MSGLRNLASFSRDSRAFRPSIPPKDIVTSYLFVAAEESRLFFSPSLFHSLEISFLIQIGEFVYKSALRSPRDSPPVRSHSGLLIQPRKFDMWVMTELILDPGALGGFPVSSFVIILASPKLFCE